MAQLEEKQVTTKEFFQNTFKFFQILGRNWRLLMLGLMVGASVSLIIDYFSERLHNYRATIIFKLEIEGGGNSMQGLGGIAGMLGGGGNVSGGDLFSGQNFPAIVQSQTVFEKALMRMVKFNGREDLLVNIVMDSSNVKKKEWSGSLFRKPFTDAINYKFESKLPDDFTPLENLIMRDLFNKLKENTSIYPMEESTMIVLSSTLTNEPLAKLWVETLLATTQDFYTEVKTKKTKTLLKVQERRLDSLLYLLNGTDRSLAKIQFEQQNIIDPSSGVRQARASRNNVFLSQQYTQQLATIEGLNLTILEQTPLFLVVTTPRFPLEQETTQTGMNLKLSSLAGLLIVMVLVVLQWMYKEIMNQ